MRNCYYYATAFQLSMQWQTNKLLLGIILLSHFKYSCVVKGQFELIIMWLALTNIQLSTGEYIIFLCMVQSIVIKQLQIARKPR